jgi:hypothetical protein
MNGETGDLMGSATYRHGVRRIAAWTGLAIVLWLCLASAPTYILLRGHPAEDGPGYSCSRSVVSTGLHPDPDPSLGRANPDGIFDSVAACNRVARSDLRNAVIIDGIPLVLIATVALINSIRAFRRRRGWETVDDDSWWHPHLEASEASV